MKILLFIGLLMGINVYSQVKPLPNESDVNMFTDDIMNLIAQNEISKAYDKILEITLIPENEIDYAKEQNIKQFNIINQRFGDITGYEFIKNEKIKDIALHKYYILRFENYFIKYNFLFYNSKKGWSLIEFNFNENFDDLWELEVI